MAANLQSLGKADEALAAYQRVVADYPKSYEAPLALMARVPILKAKGQKDEARRACETVMSQYPQSIWANQAMQQLRELKPPGEVEAAPGLPGAPTLGGQKPGGPPPLLARPPAAAPPAGPPAPQTKPSAGKP
ncbi:MAG TPA: tetratricopeptide repeat protein [Chthoniobacterales bacterium]